MGAASRSWPGFKFPGLCRGLGRVDAWLGSGWGCPLPPRQPPGPPGASHPLRVNSSWGPTGGPPAPRRSRIEYKCFLNLLLNFKKNLPAEYRFSY